MKNLKDISAVSGEEFFRQGSMLLESCLIMPLLVLLILAVVQFAQIWTARHIVAYAAYCATRSTMSVHPLQQEKTALAAAREVCAWVNLVGVPSEEDSDGNDAKGGLSVPGWGEIPNSDSIDRRVKVEVMNLNYAANAAGKSTGVASVSVTYRFPLVMPVVGQMISYLAQDGNSSKTNAEYRIVGGWTGEAVVLEDEMHLLERRSKDGSVLMDYAEKGVFPYIELKEVCVLPLPYSTAMFPMFTSGDMLSFGFDR